MGRAFEYRKAAKMKRWGAMSKIFPKLGKVITMAAKAGSPDPEMNPRLRTAILNAKAQNMPKHNIEAAIKRAMGKDAADIKEIHYEAKASYGVQLIIECATDNTTRTVANVRTYFSKSGGNVVPTGSLEFIFDRKSIFEFEKKDDMDLEELELLLIDYGLEELEEVENEIFVYGDYKSFGTLSKAFEDNDIEIKKAESKRFPNNPKEFNESELKDIDRLLEKLEDDEDVQAVYTNIAI